MSKLSLFNSKKNLSLSVPALLAVFLLGLFESSSAWNGKGRVGDVNFGNKKNQEVNMFDRGYGPRRNGRGRGFFGRRWGNGGRGWGNGWGRFQQEVRPQADGYSTQTDNQPERLFSGNGFRDGFGRRKFDGTGPRARANQCLRNKKLIEK